MGTQSQKTTVLLTGFGPFNGHEVNASWVAVEELGKTGISDHVKLHVVEVPVDYKFVSEKLPAIEKELNPLLIVHVGVSGVTEVVQIENCAHKSGYCREDVNGFIPDEEEQIQECLKTSVDVNELRKYCEKHRCCCSVESSEDAGRYLCEFIYYTSLSCKVAPVLFVHVPCLDAPYCKKELASTIKLIILGALEQIGRHHKR